MAATMLEFSSIAAGFSRGPLASRGPCRPPQTSAPAQERGGTPNGASCGPRHCRAALRPPLSRYDRARLWSWLFDRTTQTCNAHVRITADEMAPHVKYQMRGAELIPGLRPPHGPGCGGSAGCGASWVPRLGASWGAGTPRTAAAAATPPAAATPWGSRHESAWAVKGAGSPLLAGKRGWRGLRRERRGEARGGWMRLCGLRAGGVHGILQRLLHLFLPVDEVAVEGLHLRNVQHRLLKPVLWSTREVLQTPSFVATEETVLRLDADASASRWSRVAPANCPGNELHLRRRRRWRRRPCRGRRCLWREPTLCTSRRCHRRQPWRDGFHLWFRRRRWGRPHATPL